ncbi:hypothetical protein G647_06255 [Cladophialophora carrionii CBS 160.54]|uniref:RWD domain-containing protein n=1 Tax=Cladophialophora carrionii CBS 160.54 TaxID=1279043 RepID=V9D873_9EURO|nr:uncharacterized protein G647_06255 [Cladophialophora carrionii CBS 160.54]ETI22182.1 hypothetical protein G647_06255 [Cladophialophora carrionii CBS 160.54]
MGIEEQKEEREVLDSIFPDEITDTSDNAYRISITLDIPDGGHDDDDDDKNGGPPVLWLNVTYPDAYPDVGPHLDISAPPNAPRHPHLDVGEDKARLLDALGPTIEDNLGMAMVFTLVTTLKEAAEVLISDRIRQAEEAREVLVREKEEEENRKFHGTLVNRERFLEWRERFRREMEEKERKAREEEEAEEKKKRGGGKAEEKRLTGKQLWERGLAGKGDEEDIDGEDAVAAVEKLKVDG